MEEKKINTRIVFSVVAVLLLIAVVAGATYAYFSATASSAAQTVTTASLDLAFDDSTAIVNATNITPMYQSEIETKAAKKSFTVTNNGTQSMYLQMNLTEVTIDDELKDVWFRWALYEDGTRIGIGSFYEAGTEVFMQQNMVIEPGENNAKDYDLYIWIENSDEEQNAMQGKTFSGKITVNGSMTEYEKKLLGTLSYTTFAGEEVVVTDEVSVDTTATTFKYGISDYYCNADFSNLDFSLLTNVRTLNMYDSYCGAGGGGTLYFNILPISTELLSSDGIGYYYSPQPLDLSYLTNLKTIGDNFIYNLTQSIKLPSSITTIGTGAFGYNSSITGSLTIDLSNLVNLESVGENAFSGLPSSATVILPKSIQDTVTIGTGAFGSATIVYQ